MNALIHNKYYYIIHYLSFHLFSIDNIRLVQKKSINGIFFHRPHKNLRIITKDLEKKKNFHA